MIKRRLRPALLLLVLPLSAQQGVSVYKHFRHFPSGQYTQQLQGTTDGRASGAPVTQTSCSAPLSAANAAAIAKLGNQVGALSSCTTRVLRDEESIAESEQVCHLGNADQVTRTTLHAVDDKTLKIEYRPRCTAAMQAGLAHVNAALQACSH